MTDTPTPTPEAAPAPEAPAPTLGEALYPAEGDPAPQVAPEESPEPAAEPAVEKKAEAPPEPEAPVEPIPLTADAYKFEPLDGIELSPELQAAAAPLLAEANVPPEAVPALMSILKQSLEAQEAAQSKVWTDLQSKWSAETEALPEFQGERKAQSLAIIGRAMDTYGSPEAREAFNLTGAGNNPALARMFLSMATALDEGRPTPQGRPAADRTPRTIGQRLYPTNPN